MEGYTSFLWVALLDLVWRITGVEAPVSANHLSLAFSLLTLPLGAALVLRIRLDKRLRPLRILFLGLILAGVVTNRTFLAWTSSGLETAMFNFFLTLWVSCALLLPFGTRGWLAGIGSAAALACLTRPDGLLLVLVSLWLAATALYEAGRGAVSSRTPMALLPFAIVPAHLAWRRVFYGEWLPNTYFAKTVRGHIWPESGIRYFGSFAIEYALWIWLIGLFVLLLVRLKSPLSRSLPRPGSGPRRGATRGPLLRWALAAALLTGVVLWLAGLKPHGLGLAGFSLSMAILLGILNLALVPAAVVSTLVVHFLYYTVVIGGDHFEFRVYSHLVLLLFVSALWLFNELRLSPRRCALLLSLMLLLSWPIPWTHWLITHDLETRKETWYLKASIADAVKRKLPWTPGFLTAPLRAYDAMQFWLIDHGVCMRHQEHKVFQREQTAIYPSRELGSQALDAGYPVFATGAVGVISWVLPHVAIIDRYGLNDYVIARNISSANYGLMAHDRRPPAGYVECFEPNVRVDDGQLTIEPRATELTADKIIECERRYTRTR